MRAMGDLPPEFPKRARISLAVVRFLTYHNRLDGILPFFAMWWGLWTILTPTWWQYWPRSSSIIRDFYGHPEVLSWVLLLAGAVRYFGSNRKLQHVCSAAAMAQFVAWGTIAWECGRLTPMAAAGFAMYSAIAIAELMAYINVVAGIDRCSHG